jgi:hypothetical protein
LIKEDFVRKPKWLRLRSGEQSSVPKSETLKNVRRQTDQKLKQQNTQKEQQGDEKQRGDAEQKNKSP